MSASDFKVAASTFLACCDTLAMEASVAAWLLPLVQDVAAGTVEPTTLRAAFGGDHRAMAPARPGKSVAVLQLRGVLTAGPSLFSWLGVGTSMRDFMRELRTAVADPDITTIVLDVDSPGGSVQLIPEASTLMRDVRARKPVVALVAGYDCSAAYWVTSNASRIVATASATLGSLGVLGERVSVARHLEREGIDVALITSTPAKGWGHPATVLTDEERAHLTARVADTYGDLVADVAQGRRVPEAVVRATYGAGRTFSATEAKTRGMIDTVTHDIDTALAAEVERPAVLAALAARRTALTHAALASVRARFTRTALAGPRAALAAATRRGGAHS